MLVVVALGGNALLRRGEKLDAAPQLAQIDAAAAVLAALAEEHELLICHGNGPQVGLLAVESDADPNLSEPYPLDALGAQTQGMIGYWMTQALHNHGVQQPIVSVVTQTVVDASDPAFDTPHKFIGPVYTESEARSVVTQHGWSMSVDGTSYRRVVPSPEPIRLVEQDSVIALARAGTLVVCGGGGGAPVVEDASGTLRGVEAVVDKDHVASLLARAIGADALLVLTDVPRVLQHYGTATPRPLSEVYSDELAAETFAAGSMGPKIDACVRFVRATGRPAYIGALEDAADVLRGVAGTTILDRRTRDRETGRGVGHARGEPVGPMVRPEVPETEE